MPKKFELFMGCFGNGTTVCNKAVMEHGDYKVIAHITDWGKIKWYVPEATVPEDVKEKIKLVAAKDRENYLKLWNGYSLQYRYRKVLDALPVSEMLKLVKNCKLSMYEKVKKGEQILYELY